MTITPEILFIVIPLILLIFPAGLYMGRLAQKVEQMGSDHKDFAKDIKSEIRGIRKLLTCTLPGGCTSTDEPEEDA